MESDITWTCTLYYCRHNAICWLVHRRGTCTVLLSNCWLNECFYRKCPPDMFMINLSCIYSSCSTWCLQEGIAFRSCVFNRLQLLRKKQKPVKHQGLPRQGKMTWHITNEDPIIYLYCLQMYYPIFYFYGLQRMTVYSVY